MPRIRLVALVPLFIRTGCGGADSQPHAGDESAPAGEYAAAKSEIGANIDRYLSVVRALGFSGAIIVTHEGGEVLREGHGLVDRETRRPRTPITVQTHGSITKQMTRAAILFLLLESRGELSLDEAIGSYFDNKDPVERIRPFLDRISQISSQFGNLEFLHLIGSLENVPGSRFGDLGPWTPSCMQNSMTGTSTGT